MNIIQLSKKIADGGYDTSIAKLYGSVTQGQKDRYVKAAKEFSSIFGDTEGARLLSVPGRSEIGGNHTDHNHGRVLACAVNLDIIAVAAPNGTNKVCIASEGFEPDTVSLDELEPSKEEYGRSSSLIRGVCARLKSLGYKVEGFNAYTTSNVLKGSGLSSSAAFEVMTSNIISNLFNNGTIDHVLMAKTGQYAECEYFGKPCGLMDQTACAVGGFVAIDFKDTEKPVIEKIDFDFGSTGYDLCIVDTAGDHANLSDDYAAIRSEMSSVAKYLGHENLRECSEGDFVSKMPEIRKELGDRAVLRAIHFFGDNERALKEAQVLKADDFKTFLNYVIESGKSSYMYLQNIYSISYPENQGLALALAIAEKILDKDGAWRVHGGGFAGTIQAFVPHDSFNEFAKEMNRVFGENACQKLSVNPAGAFCFE